MEHLREGHWQTALRLSGSDRRQAAPVLAQLLVSRLASEGVAAGPLEEIIGRDPRKRSSFGMALLERLEAVGPVEAELLELDEVHELFADRLLERFCGETAMDLASSLTGAWAERDSEGAERALRALLAMKRMPLRIRALRAITERVYGEELRAESFSRLEGLLGKLGLDHRHCLHSALEKTGEGTVRHLRKLYDEHTLCGKAVCGMDPHAIEQGDEGLCDCPDCTDDEASQTVLREHEAELREVCTPRRRSRFALLWSNYFQLELDDALGQPGRLTYAKARQLARQAAEHSLVALLAEIAKDEASVRSDLRGGAEREHLAQLLGAPESADLSETGLRKAFDTVVRERHSRLRFVDKHRAKPRPSPACSGVALARSRFSITGRPRLA